MNFSNLIFVFEFVSGGGFGKNNITSSLFCEGFGMLKTIILDFKMLNFEISTLLDHRVFFLSRFLQADIIKKVNAEDNYLNLFKKLVKECKYAFIIAPEASNILYELTKIVKKFDKKILSMNLNAINQSTSKIKTYKIFQENEIPTPKTYEIPYKRKNLDLDFIIQKFDRLKCPIIIKPDDGVGAERIYYFEREDQIKIFFRDYKDRVEPNRRYILQEFIEGKDLSLSLIGSPHLINSQINNSIILSVNSQDINIKNQNNNSEYYGGSVPVENNKELIKFLAKNFKNRVFSEFNGYYGIDFIRKNDSSNFFIEINPRLTTSYLGVRNVINYNCAELIYNSKLTSPESFYIKYLNFSIFSRIELISKESKSIKELNEQIIPKLMKEIPELITPPISFDKSNRFSCFIATKTKDLTSSKKRVKDIFRFFQKMNFEVLDQYE